MFKGDYLRVLTPVTSDGVSPVVENDRIKYREDHLPLTAQKALVKKNERLPTGLRKKIEVVSASIKPVIKTTPKPPPVVHETDVDDLDDENLELEETEQEEVKETKTPAKKRGPKKKNG